MIFSEYSLNIFLVLTGNRNSKWLCVTFLETHFHCSHFVLDNALVAFPRKNPYFYFIIYDLWRVIGVKYVCWLLSITVTNLAVNNKIYFTLVNNTD